MPTDANSLIHSPEEVAMTVALLKESMKLYDYRLLKLETKFDQLQETITHRFDKIDEANEARREEMIEIQKLNSDELRKITETTNKTLQRLEETEKKLKSVKETTEKDLAILQNEVDAISSLKFKILGAISLIGVLIAIFGRDLLKFFVS